MRFQGGPTVQPDWSPEIHHAGLPHEPGRPDWIVLSADQLAPVARRWARWRASQGHAVRVWTVGEVQAGRRLTAQEFLKAVRKRLTSALGTAEPDETVFLLLLGDARDPDFHPEVRTSEVPTLSWKGEYLTDMPYADLNGDGWPDIAVGRVPVETIEQAQAVLAKTRRYEERPDPGLWRHRILLFASEGYFGALVDALMERIGLDLLRSIPESWDILFLHARKGSVFGLPPGRYTQVLLREIRRGAFLAVYTGHGYLDALEELPWGDKPRPILDEKHAALMACGAHCPILVLAACHTGDFGHGTSLAEVILRTPDGPPAVLAATDVSHPYANALLAFKVTRLLTGGHVATVGEAFLESLLTLGLPDSRPLLRLEHLVDILWSYEDRKEVLDDNRRMYVLLGDPALKVPRPGRDLLLRACHLDRRSVTVCGFAAASPRVRVELRWPRFHLAGATLPAADADSALRRWEAANDNLLAAQEIPISSGYFATRFALPDGWWDPGLVVRAVTADGASAAALTLSGPDRPAQSCPSRRQDASGP